MTHTCQTDAFFVLPGESFPSKSNLIEDDMLIVLRLSWQAPVVRGSPLNLLSCLGVLPRPDGLPTADLS
jgi:hypothetical protein